MDRRVIRKAWAPAAPLDEQAAVELYNYISNSSSLNNMKWVLFEALWKHKKRGKYDTKRAPAIFLLRLTQDAAKAYASEHDQRGNWSNIFSVSTRRKVAELLRDDVEEEAELGGFEDPSLRVKGGKVETASESINPSAVLYSELRREGLDHANAMRHAGLGGEKRTAAAGPKALANDLLGLLESGDMELFWERLPFMLEYAPGMDALTMDMWLMLKKAADAKDEFQAKGLLEDVRNRYPEGTYDQFFAPQDTPQYDALMKVWDEEGEAFTRARTR